MLACGGGELVTRGRRQDHPEWRPSLCLGLQLLLGVVRPLAEAFVELSLGAPARDGLSVSDARQLLLAARRRALAIMFDHVSCRLSVNTLKTLGSQRVSCAAAAWAAASASSHTRTYIIHAYVVLHAALHIIRGTERDVNAHKAHGHNYQKHASHSMLCVGQFSTLVKALEIFTWKMTTMCAQSRQINNPSHVQSAQK